MDLIKLLIKLKRELTEQKNSKFNGNIYHFSEVAFAYNSNKIEGGKLTEEETEEIFSTNSFLPKTDDAIKLDDLIEMRNYFSCLITCLIIEKINIM